MPKTIEELNDECKQCIKDYNKAGIPFDPRTCRSCNIGLALHNALILQSEGERKLGEVDWTGRYEGWYEQG